VLTSSSPPMAELMAEVDHVELVDLLREEHAVHRPRGQGDLELAVSAMTPSRCCAIDRRAQSYGIGGSG